MAATLLLGVLVTEPGGTVELPMLILCGCSCGSFDDSDEDEDEFHRLTTLLLDARKRVEGRQKSGNMQVR